MSLKTVTLALLKVVLLVVVFFVVNLISAALIPIGLAWTPSADLMPQIFGGLLLTALVDVLVVSLVITRSNWHGWKLVAATGLAWYGAMTFMGQIETAWFAASMGLPYSLPLGVALRAVPLVLIVTPMAMWLWGQGGSRAEPPAAVQRLPLTAPEWAWKFAVIAIVYAVLYLAFGFIVAWQNPALRNVYGNGADQQVFSLSLLVPFQLLRGMLWTLFALPVIRMTRGPNWQVALLVALLLALPLNIVHFTPNPVMPDFSVRLSHFIETTSSNFIFGLAITWLLSWRPTRAAVKSLRPARL